MPVAGKTGSSSNYQDRWFVGCTPYYVAAVWTGYDMPERIHVSGNPAAQLWKKVMTPVHDGLPWEAFTYPYLGENTGIFGYDDSTLTDDDYLDNTDSEDNYGDGGSGTSSSRDNYIPGGNSREFKLRYGQRPVFRQWLSRRRGRQNELVSPRSLPKKDTFSVRFRVFHYLR